MRLPRNDAQNQRRPTGGHVHHGAAGEIDRFDLGVRVPDAVHEAVDAPDHVGEREINDEHPERDEQQDRGELHAFGDGADDQRRSDDREHQLIHGEHVVRNPGGVIGVGIRIHALEKRQSKVPENSGSRPLHWEKPCCSRT